MGWDHNQYKKKYQMTQITNAISIKRRIDSERGQINLSRRLGIIFTGEFANLDEHLVEAEIAKEFDLSAIKEIITVGKREKTFIYANRFAKKYNIHITAIPLETYNLDDDDLFIKRNANIVYQSYDVIIFHGDENQNLVAWNALSVAERIVSSSGKCIFISNIKSPKLTGFEKEITVFFKKSNFFSEVVTWMESRYLELMSNERIKFAKYIKQGESMTIKHILYKLTEVIMKDYDRDFISGETFFAEGIFDSLICLADKKFGLNEFGSPNEKKIERYIKKNINPKFYYRKCRREENVIGVLLYNDWYRIEYLLSKMVSYYEIKGDEEACAALCFGKWIRYHMREEYTDEAIIRKFSNLQKSL